MIYSTPSCYLKALYDLVVDWPTKTDDFFPYASDSYAFWTGYFTSRPTSKRFERVGNHFLQITKQLSATADIQESFFDESLNKLRKIMGVMQHHDAITGTEKQHVANDYHKEIYEALVDCGNITSSVLNQISTGFDPEISSKKFEFNSCLNLNISICDVSENSEKFMVTVYNPLGRKTSQFIRFPVAGDDYEVTGSKDENILTQLVPIPSALRKQIFYRLSSTANELIFQATDVPAIGYKSYFISRKTSQIAQIIAEKSAQENISIGDEKLKLTFNSNGFLESISVDGETNKLTQELLIYKEVGGDNLSVGHRSAGTYVMRTYSNETGESPGQNVTIEVVRGNLVDEIHQKFNDWISQVIRVYKTERFVEFEWLVGPIPTKYKYAKSVISRFSTDIDTKGEFFTDSNGREMMKRKRDFRETWDVKLKEKIPGNYYPVTTKIAIEDKKHRLAILTDRSQGGSSMVDGSVELMVKF